MHKYFGFIVFSFFLLLLMGCTGQRPFSTPSSALATAVPSPSPTPTPPTIPPTATPAAMTLIGNIPVIRIKNAAANSYLAEDNGVAVLIADTATDDSDLWGIEDYSGSKRLQNQASGNYLAIENLEEYVEVIPIISEWMSPRWTVAGDPAEGAIGLRNVWHNWQVLYVTDAGQVHYDNVPTTNDTARWLFEAEDGTPLARTTPEPVIEIPPATNPPGSRGAAVPWLEYEAETAVTNGDILEPDRTFGRIASESSGRSGVQLDETGEYVEFVSEESANSVVVRFVIPDSEDGTGQDATISLYVDGEFRQKLPLTSKYAWSYGGEEWTFNTPAAGGAHHFYDEAHALVGDIPAGADVRLQKDADDSASYYVIDLLDLEQVAPPLAQPASSLSIVEECGAVPDDGQDDGDAIQDCIDRAKGMETAVYFPPGIYNSNTHGFEVSDVTIQGAGMWYTTISGSHARFNCTGNNCRYFDFAILGETVTRDDQSPENGFNGGAGLGSRLENIWVEHTKVGYWVGGYSQGLVITGSRFRNLFADGVNFCNGTSHSLIENSHFRNTGDDALASWSPKGSGVNTGNVFRFNSVQIPWRANCYAIYGGKDNRIQDNLCADVVTYPGILIAQEFNSNPFGGSTMVQRNSLIRAGGSMFHKEHGALKVSAAQGEINDLQVRDLLIESPRFTGIQLEGSYPLFAEFDGVEINHAGTHGIYLASNLEGEAAFSYTTVTNSGGNPLVNYAPKARFDLILGEGNSGW